MIVDEQEEIAEIEWTVTGKVKRIRFDNGSLFVFISKTRPMMGEGGANAADGQLKQTAKDYKYAATMVVAIVTVGQGAALVYGGGTLLSLEGASLGLDFALNADGIIDYSSNFNEAGKKMFQTLNLLKAQGNIVSQVKKGHMGGGVEFFDTAGNVLGTISIVDNTLQLDGNKNLFEMIENTQKNESEK